MAPAGDRVPIWNSFFKLAWSEAKRCFEINHSCTSGSTFDPVDGGTLPRDQHHALAAITLCSLAIEARANHLIDELAEDGGLSKDTARAAKWLPTKEKWFLLPALAGKGIQLSAAIQPHQAIAQICDLRNEIMHVRFDEIVRKLPAVGTIEGYFMGFVEAMEDMNVVLERGVPAPRPEVLAKGRFTRL